MSWSFDCHADSLKIITDIHEHILPSISYGINIYPNPASDYIKVEIEISYKLRLSDNQPSGVYLLQVKDDRDRVGIEKFVVE